MPVNIDDHRRLVGGPRSRRSGGIVGGLFGLERGHNADASAAWFLTRRDVHLANARSGIRLLADLMRPTSVWAPSFLCQAIVDAVESSAATLRYYEVDYDLGIPTDRWTSELAPGDLVLLIDYFGFPFDRGMGARARERGAMVLEDASQALLSRHVGLHSDFVLFSPRKWVGVPDGGILRLGDGCSLEMPALEPPAAAWWLKALDAAVLRREFDGGLPTREWYELFREAEQASPVGPYAMSQLTRTILENSVDYPQVARRREENYRTLLEDLADYAIFPVLQPGVTPLGFPVRIRNRDEVRQRLFEQEIYPPVHWPVAGVVPRIYEASHLLADRILTIPCDQRYGREDMRRIARLFLKHARRA